MTRIPNNLKHPRTTLLKNHKPLIRLEHRYWRMEGEMPS